MKSVSPFCYLLLLVLGLVAGCEKTNPPTIPVSGSVTYQGKPCDGALLVFHPQGEGQGNSVKPFATSGADGSYRLTTYAQDDGAQAGPYKVTIVWNKPDPAAKMSLSGEGGGGADRLGGKFGDPAGTPLDVTVTAADENKHDFKLE